MKQAAGTQMRVLADKFLKEGVLDVVIMMQTADHIMVFVLNDNTTRMLKRGEFVMTRPS